MEIKSLTPKQKAVLDFIKSFSNKHDYSPSLGEIARHFKKSVPTIHQYIETLQAKGHLDKIDNISRGIQLNNNKTEIFKLGYIAAGNPIEPLENPESVKVPAEMVKGMGQYYALEVKGDSMIDEGILDRDIVVVKHQNFADNGDIIVAITEEGATLKVLRKRNNKVFLEPRNKSLKNIYPKRLEIRGKFFGLIRNKPF